MQPRASTQHSRSIDPNDERFPDGRGARGFTLIELMVAMAIFSIAMAGAIGTSVICQKLWHANQLHIANTTDGNMALSRLIYGVGNHGGLRTASSISIDNNYHGTWYDPDNYPPAPGASTHYLTQGSPDGSWRITTSNTFDGVKWIDYNRSASNIVFWTDTGNQSSRQLVCNHVSSATVSTNNNGMNIVISLFRQAGQFSASNQFSTFVLMRNKR